MWGSEMGSLYVQEEGRIHCQETLVIFPCSSTLGGNVILLLVYGYCLLKASELLSFGCELLLKESHPGLVGGLLLPILCALPDSFLILVSGMAGSQEEAQGQVLVGMGLLAGSTIMQLTLLWGSSMIAARCDLSGSRGKLTAKDKTLEKGWNLRETGVMVDGQAMITSLLMMVSVSPYLVAQAPVIFGWSRSVSQSAVLAGCVIAALLLLSYCIFQSKGITWYQELRIWEAKRRFQRSHALQRMSSFAYKKALGSLLDNNTALDRLFDQFDTNQDNQLSSDEMRGLIVGLGIHMGINGRGEVSDEITDWITELDTNRDQRVSRNEFVSGVRKWIRKFSLDRKSNRNLNENGDQEAADPVFQHHVQETQEFLKNLVEDQQMEDEDSEGEIPTIFNLFKFSKEQLFFLAVSCLLGGTSIAAILATPMVGVIGDISKITNISPFFISFVVTPLATNLGEAWWSINFAKKKTKVYSSLVFSKIYGAVTMNNTMSLAVFLAVVRYRGLTWDFSSEVLVILLAEAVIGVLACTRVTFPLWMAFVALLLYPISVAMVFILDTYCGWA